jgi:glycosyltransferase involved in cell wall biosynthesis
MSNFAVLVVPGSIETRTGGYIYDKRMVAGLRSLGWSVVVRELDPSFPRPSQAARADAVSAFESFPDAAVVLVDSLALGVIPEILERHARRLRIVALVHSPLAADVDLSSGEIARVAELEARAMRTARVVVLTGAAARPLISDYDIPASRVVVVEPGSDLAQSARGSGGSEVQMVCVATVNAGKGHVDLLAALAAVGSRAWRLTCAGSLTRHPETAAIVQGMVSGLQLTDRVSWVGDLDRDALETVYDRSDVFVLATRRETYGMAVAEALAHGLPVVSTATGAIPSMVANEAGLLVSPGDTVALKNALSRVIEDPDLRCRLAEGARAARQRLPRWEQSVTRLAATLDSVRDD